MTQRLRYAILAGAGLLLVYCGDADSEDTEENENTEALCNDGIDNDGDGATDCDDLDCDGLCVRDPIPADISGMPVPSTSGAARPEGAAGNLQILDWAGFKAAVSYTFDDSQPSHIQHYDALQATGVRMTFFAVSETAGGSAYDETFSQAVADGHEIGNHTAHHCNAKLTDCGWGVANESAEAEIEECNDYIIDNFGQDGVWTMASPYGDAGWGQPAEKYFFLNRGITTNTIAPNDNSRPFNLPSYMVGAEEPLEELTARLDATHEDGEWLIFCFHSILPTSQNWYNGVSIDTITGSIDHVKDKGDMWTDTMATIGAYWVGQKLLGGVTPETDGDETVWTWTLPDNFPPGRYLRVTVDGGTLTQGGHALTWSEHGYYEVSLDIGELTLAP